MSRNDAGASISCSRSRSFHSKARCTSWIWAADRGRSLSMTCQLSPRARVLAVDLDAVLLHMGQQVAERVGHPVQFLQADLRDGGWWQAYQEHFDLVISATALHWLAPARLREVYQHVFKVLKPGSWFMNSDHVASDAPHLQERYRQLVAVEQKAAFAASGPTLAEISVGRTCSTR